MVKSKRYYAERIINGLQNSVVPHMDFKIDERDVFPVMDDVVNGLAEKRYFDNWRFTGAQLDEQFITTFEDITVVDQADGMPSYFVFPANYADLPWNGGIIEIWPKKFQVDGKDHSVVVISRSDWRKYKNNQAGRFENRLAGYPQGQQFIFTTDKVKAKFGDMNIRLAIKDSSQIAIDAPYPIPANHEGMVIDACIAFFVNKRNMPTDTVRDKNDLINPIPRRAVNNVAE